MTTECTPETTIPGAPRPTIGAIGGAADVGCPAIPAPEMPIARDLPYECGTMEPLADIGDPYNGPICPTTTTTSLPTTGVTTGVGLTGAGVILALGIIITCALRRIPKDPR